MSEKEKIIKSFQGLIKVGDNKNVFNQLYELNDKNAKLENKNSIVGWVLLTVSILSMLFFIGTCIPESTPEKPVVSTTKKETQINTSKLQRQVVSEYEQLEQERCSKIGKNNPYGLKCFLSNCSKGHCVLDKKTGDYFVNFVSEEDAKKQWEEFNRILNK